ncbi:MAG: S8/S53 family peptidase, partial [Humibacillus sp.]|nr:S8/S53 family peptidase [Humibacillus sp.]
VGGFWGGVGGYWGGVGGYWGGVGGSALQEYSVPGRGGRMPVSLALPDPGLRAEVLDRNPVIVVPDTEIAKHPWFKDSAKVVRLRMKNGRLVPAESLADSRSEAVAPATFPPGDSSAQADPPGLLQGHATFIAGLIRQGCPEATIVSIPVMGDDGIVDEGVMLDVLQALLDRHIHGQEHGPVSDVVDVLSLSLGYYAEDSTYTSGPVADMLDRFAESGVAVVAGVGNDGTSSPFVPAALAAEPPKRILPKSNPPVASVGACNPDGTTVALFSNNLAVVSAVRLGVSVVSTLPLTNGMGQPSTKIAVDGTVRCTVDPDDYTGGFGVWSGTSFATPVFAAELAVALIDQGDLTDVTARAMRGRAIRALRTCIGKVMS